MSPDKQALTTRPPLVFLGPTVLGRVVGVNMASGTPMWHPRGATPCTPYSYTKPLRMPQVASRS